MMVWDNGAILKKSYSVEIRKQLHCTSILYLINEKIKKATVKRRKQQLNNLPHFYVKCDIAHLPRCYVTLWTLQLELCKSFIMEEENIWNRQSGSWTWKLAVTFWEKSLQDLWVTHWKSDRSFRLSPRQNASWFQTKIWGFSHMILGLGCHTPCHSTQSTT